MEALVAAIEARHRPTARHSRAVVDLAEAVARRLGLSPAAVRDVARVAALHDVGKLSVPDAILGKAGPLDELEMTVMRDHAAAGGRIVARLPDLAPIADAVRATHERWDGLGYPDGLAGPAIPLASRITFACDAYEAMVGGRVYRPPLEREQAIDELLRCRGTQFCPRSVDALIATLSGDRELADLAII